MAHVTDLGFTEADLLTALSNGEVRVQTHPDFPELTIWNYTEETQFRNKWNKVTLACRGLIINKNTGEVVARPWEKFFNFGQMDNRIDSMAPVEVTDKVDGSLGILYRQPNGELAIATRGSFASEQAVEANKIWSESYSNVDIPDDYTFLFEILVPWNRIVVQYDYDSEYLQQGRRVLPQRTSRNDSREHLYSTEQGLEDVPNLQERSTEARQGEARGEAQAKCTQLAFSEQGEGQRTQGEVVREDSSSNSGSQEGQALRGLSTNISSGVHGFRPSTGDREEVQYRSGEESTSTANRNGEVRTGVRELSQNQDIHYTPGNLVLLGAVHKQYGHYLGPLEAQGILGWGGPVTEVWQYKSFVDALSFPDREGKEGVVIRSGTNIVKLKQADYVELHRIVTNLSPKTIWEMLQRGETQESICVNIPDEFHGYVKDIAGKLEMDFLGIKVDTRLDFQKIKHKLWKDDGETISRRAWAEEIKKSKYPGLLFMMLDDKNIDQSIWNMIKPRGDVKSLVSDEG